MEPPSKKSNGQTKTKSDDKYDFKVQNRIRSSYSQNLPERKPYPGWMASNYRVRGAEQNCGIRNGNEINNNNKAKCNTKEIPHSINVPTCASLAI